MFVFVLCKNPVTSLYLAGVSPNFPIFFCIKSLMLDLTNYIQFPTLLYPVCLSIPAKALPTCSRDSFHADKRPRGSVANNKNKNKQTNKQSTHILRGNGMCTVLSFYVIILFYAPVSVLHQEAFPILYCLNMLSLNMMTGIRLSRSLVKLDEVKLN